MTPTLSGRIQTRLALLATVGLGWTLLIAPLLRGEDAALADVVRTLLAVLAVVAALGVGWELVYHGLQQLRWEKDWPTLFGLLAGLNEGAAAWLVVRGLPGVTGGRFVAHFATTWLVVWLVANGPMRVVSLRWRFRGGRLW